MSHCFLFKELIFNKSFYKNSAYLYSIFMSCSAHIKYFLSFGILVCSCFNVQINSFSHSVHLKLRQFGSRRKKKKLLIPCLLSFFGHIKIHACSKFYPMDQYLITVLNYTILFTVNQIH